MHLPGSIHSIKEKPVNLAITKSLIQHVKHVLNKQTPR